MPRNYKIRGYTVGQSPNLLLWLVFAALLVSLLTGGTLNDVARAILYVALAAWAYEEVTRGVNGFRKGVGAVTLVLVVVAVARALG